MGNRPPGLDKSFTDDLARDAVPGVARGHESSGWWREIDSMADGAEVSHRAGSPVPTLKIPMPDEYRRIIYFEEDPVAQSLAERLVGIGAAGPGSSPEAAKLEGAVPGLMDDSSSLSAAGMPEEELKMSLEKGDEFAYIIWLPLRIGDTPPEFRELITRANWLSFPGDDLADALLPLVDTRRYAIVRRETAGLSIDWYGNIYITGRLNRPTMPPPGR